MLTMQDRVHTADIVSGEKYNVRNKQFVADFRSCPKDQRNELLNGFSANLSEGYDRALTAAIIDHVLSDVGHPIPQWVRDEVLETETYVEVATTSKLRKYIDAHLDPIFLRHGIRCDIDSFSIV